MPPLLPLLLMATAIATGATAPKNLLKFCAEWQTRLGLGDWAINLHIVRQNELHQDALGKVTWNIARKQADIKVLTRWDYYDTEPARAEVDQKRTILHELMHILLRVAADDDQRAYEEVVAERFAQAIVREPAK